MGGILGEPLVNQLNNDVIHGLVLQGALGFKLCPQGIWHVNANCDRFSFHGSTAH